MDYDLKELLIHAIGYVVAFGILIGGVVHCGDSIGETNRDRLEAEVQKAVEGRLIVDSHNTRAVVELETQVTRCAYMSELCTKSKMGCVDALRTCAGPTHHPSCSSH